MKKKELREQCKKEITLISKDQKKIISDLTVEKIIKFIRENKSIKKIGCYWSTINEIDSLFLINYLLKNQYQVFLPKTFENYKINFMKIDSINFEFIKKFEIKEPINNVIDNDLDLFIVPALAFSKKGKRLGYGSGYYDRFFEKKNNLNLIGCSIIKKRISDVFFEEYDIEIKTIF